VVGRLCRRDGARCRGTEWFLVLWLVLEILGYFALSPFPAVRRVLGVVVAGIMLAGRLAARTCRSPERRSLVRGTALVTALLGCAFAAVDLRDAHAQRTLTARASRWVRRHDPDPAVWYLGGNGFWFYAERAGMRRVAPGAAPGPGDWLICDDVYPEPPRLGAHPPTPCVDLSVRDRLPLRANPGFYTGGTPLEHHEGPRAHLTVYRQPAQ
jgi:hypothetical protein